MQVAVVTSKKEDAIIKTKHKDKKNEARHPKKESKSKSKKRKQKSESVSASSLSSSSNSSNDDDDERESGINYDDYDSFGKFKIKKNTSGKIALLPNKKINILLGSQNNNSEDEDDDLDGYGEE